MDSGKTRRLRKLLGSKPTLIVPIDHGFTSGPLKGLEQITQVKSWINSKRISAVLAHKGIVERLIDRNILDPNKPVILHLNGSPASDLEPYKKRQVTCVEVAINLGCDAVSIDLNFNESLLAWNFELLGRIVDKARKLSLPVLTMISNRSQAKDTSEYIAHMRHYIRSCYELGVDLVKVSLPMSKPDDFYQKLFSGLQEDVPIIMAGGEQVEQFDLFYQLRRIQKYGLSGFCIGRNIFQAENPLCFLENFYRYFSEKELKYDANFAKVV